MSARYTCIVRRDFVADARAGGGGGIRSRRGLGEVYRQLGEDGRKVLWRCSELRNGKWEMGNGRIKKGGG